MHVSRTFTPQTPKTKNEGGDAVMDFCDVKME
jgi:hypothetical protein